VANSRPGMRFGLVNPSQSAAVGVKVVPEVGKICENSTQMNEPKVLIMLTSVFRRVSRFLLIAFFN